MKKNKERKVRKRKITFVSNKFSNLSLAWCPSLVRKSKYIVFTSEQDLSNFSTRTYKEKTQDYSITHNMKIN